MTIERTADEWYDYKVGERETQLLADVVYQLQRASGAGHVRFDSQRDCGVSSNAIVRYAYTGLEPTEWQWPSDRSDYAACVRAVRKMPRHRRTRQVLAMLGIEQKVRYAMPTLSRQGQVIR